MSRSYSACSSRLAVTHPSKQLHASWQTPLARWLVLRLCQTPDDSAQRSLAWLTSFAPRKWWAQWAVKMPPAHIGAGCIALEVALQSGWILHEWTSSDVVVEKSLRLSQSTSVVGWLVPCILPLLRMVVSCQCWYRMWQEWPNIMYSRISKDSHDFNLQAWNEKEKSGCVTLHVHVNLCAHAMMHAYSVPVCVRTPVDVCVCDCVCVCVCCLLYTSPSPRDTI